MSSPVLELQDVRVYFNIRRGVVKAADGIDLQLFPGERFGLVGESGSGKTTTALAILRMIKPPGKIEGGRIILDGDTDLLTLSDEEMRQIRLRRIAMIPQGAMNSLNPVMRIKDQMILAMRTHGIHVTNAQLMQRIEELLDSVGLQPNVAHLYPHELSGGMKQRVCIAIAISMHPQVILADEPTSALDVVVQRRIMQTLRTLQERLGAAVILVGHDMGLMAQFVDRLGVMYGGKLVEVGTVEEIFTDPKHPYTQLLISSIPSLDRKRNFQTIPGMPLSLHEPPPGCLFHPRCPQAMPQCSTVVPRTIEVTPGRDVLCLLYDEERTPQMKEKVDGAAS
ncbi:MAG: ABC transporter ATP-binding protein [Anaerolineae bacterium]|nr:ABC transporter ATP-binding protein [Anaerolineae bacterium]